ncbi:unnamed protein product [Clonostachys rosea f. rosea IK726]|uniref:Uncharacterized protein n=1 Tax=Clonostachys rosea f. rosea IK726 TaxID=1349383 RepID=A0ACA9U391_BIOOC|nr:unnamed protein product [Clonostachys rosea f. rosea IK726]
MSTDQFPSLEPAFTVRLYPGKDYNIVTSGKVTSEPGFEIPLDAEVVMGSDMARTAPTQTHTHIDVNAILRNNDGDLLSYKYTGLVEVDEALVAILAGDPKAKSTSFGKALSHVTFETGSESLKELGTSLFVGSARFVIEDGVFSIETKVSRVKG